MKGRDWNFFAVKRSSPALVIRDGRYKLLLFFSRDIGFGTAFADRHSDPSILDRINCLLVGVGIQGHDLRVLEGDFRRSVEADGELNRRIGLIVP